VLGLLCIAPSHGWTVAAELKNGHGIGAIWPLSTPLVYRAFRALEERGLIEEERVERGLRGPHRTVFRATGGGQLKFRRWLREPVEQARDMQSLILLKLVLAEGAGITPPPIVRAQTEAFTAEIESLEAELDENTGVEWVVGNFRIESTRAVLRFIEKLDGESHFRPRLVASA
jgi:DNA-binding PadR family transcriptional regulator